MPPKRRAQPLDSTLNEQEDDGKPKKRRVSLACDACRAAREKCDGGKPPCGTCLAQARVCSYTPATRKRGVQTGYLRTIELSLAWLFDQIPECEEKLHDFLTNASAGHETRSLLGKGGSGHHLQGLWNESRVRRAVDGLLSDNKISHGELSANDTDVESDRALPRQDNRALTDPTSAGLYDGVMPASYQTGRRETHLETALRLPPEWRHLLRVYATYTHCWLPIVSPNTLNTLAASYESTGATRGPVASRGQISSYAELWAALAVAAFQDGFSAAHERFSDLSPSRIFQIAQSLIPPYDEDCDIHHINALMMQAMVFIGRGETMTASRFLGKAARLLRQIRLEGSLLASAADATAAQYDVSSIACSFLNILTSLAFNQAPTANLGGPSASVSGVTVKCAELEQSWQCLPFVSTFSSADAPEQLILDPMRVLVQLHALVSTLSNAVTSPARGSDMSRPIGPEDLVQKLDPRFSFCNSLVSSGSTPALPAAYLVKLVFHTANVGVTSNLRPSLLSGFNELVHSSFANFGANHSPPIAVLLLQLVQKRVDGEISSGAERMKLHTATETLHMIWKDDAGSEAMFATYTPPTTVVGAVSQEKKSPQKAMTSLCTISDSDFVRCQERASPPVQVGGFGLQPSAERSARQPHFGYASAVPSNAPLSDAGPFADPIGGLADDHVKFHGDLCTSQNFDHDAVFDDLGSAGHVNNAVNAYFTSNFGFALDRHAAEIFKDDFGV
ncbi:activator [Moelleriella libera RCEF 2490]|uniref:Activator n=1 Tax=Moelleriella libera RCEF 2490 TaxID=1081109 RepID=A0A168ASL4_9HYPO|nr:activator [Moelleriella libera RCEF 2490]